MNFRLTWRMLAVRSAALIGGLFGAVTVFSAASVLVGPGAASAGDYVPFIAWFNFLGGSFYVVAALGLWLGRRWAAPLAAALAILTVLAFTAMGGYIAAGARFEMRTVAAMTLRTLMWIAIAILACSTLVCARRQSWTGRTCPSRPDCSLSATWTVATVGTGSSHG